MLLLCGTSLLLNGMVWQHTPFMNVMCTGRLYMPLFSSRSFVRYFWRYSEPRVHRRSTYTQIDRMRVGPICKLSNEVLSNSRIRVGPATTRMWIVCSLRDRCFLCTLLAERGMIRITTFSLTRVVRHTLLLSYSVRPSARLSVCHTDDPRLNGSIYQNMLLCTARLRGVSSFLRQNFAIQSSGIHPERRN